MLHANDELTWRCQAGDLGAFEELVRRYRRLVYRVAFGILGDADEAEDVTQDAFIRAYRALRRDRAPTSFVSWLRRIAVNCALTRLRSREMEKRKQSSLGLRLEDVGSPPRPDEQLDMDRLGRRIRQAVCGLSAAQRLAFSLFHLEDMDILRTAEAMGCSRNAVKVHLHRARRKLARLLANELQEG